MPMFRRGPRCSPDIKNGGGRLLVDLSDARANGKPKMELCHHDCHGGGRMLVDLLDAHAYGEPKIEFWHHHGGVWLLVDL